MEVPCPEIWGGAWLFVASVSVCPENSCEEPKVGGTEGFANGGDVGVVKDVVLGNVAVVDIEVVAFGWSAIIDGGVWMAFVSDESIDEACD